jgi:hypothetical protein
VLEESGIIRREVVGRTHRLSLEPEARALWGRLFDVVDEYLKEEGPR